MGSYTEQLTRIEHHLKNDAFEESTMLCGKEMEFLLKHILEKYLLKADERQKTDVRSFISARYKSSLEKLTAGQIVILFDKSNVIESLTKKFGLDVKTFGIINLREMVDIRNKTAHTAVKDELQEKADAYVMYGNLLRLSRIAKILIPEPVGDSRDSSKQTVAIPEHPMRDARKVIISEKHIVATTPNPPESLILRRNKSSFKHFIYIDDISPTKMRLIPPDGPIIGLEMRNFDEPIEMEEELAVNKQIVSKEQVQKFHESMAENVQRLAARHTMTVPKTHSKRSPFHYRRPLGSKGYRNLEDYLIPVIKNMGVDPDYRKAFHAVANKLDVRYNTVSAQCTRTLGLTTEEFVSMVKQGKIIDLLKRKYPDQMALINRELVKP